MIKVCVYAISKNEMKFAARWLEAVKEADYVCVLDTGSTDGTYEFLKNAGVIVEQKIYKNFRFDVARNDSLKLIPNDADVCFCIDLDEIPRAGWADEIRNNWKPNTGIARYRYTWNFNPDGSEGIVFYAGKIHKNGAYVWTHPVHEVLKEATPNNYTTITLTNLQLDHHADNSKPRSSYLPLLELSVKESPLDDRNMHYLGREYMFYGQYTKAIKTLNRHLRLPTATWTDERVASLRYIAKCYLAQNKTKLAEKYLKLALLEGDYLREPYYELAKLYYEKENYLNCALTLNAMLKINTRTFNYMSSPICWGSLPFDYLSICYYQLNKLPQAIQAITEAIRLNPTEQRLKDNLNLFQEKISSNK